MSTNDTPATDTEDLTKSLKALNLQQESGKKRIAKADSTARGPRASRNGRNQKQTPRNDNANKRSTNQQNWRTQAQPLGHGGPNVTTRSQTQAARAQQPQKDRHQDPKQYPLPRPKPTLSYLKQALQPPKPSDRPRQLLVILDLNGTLVHRESRDAKSKFTKRPFCEKFMQYLTSEHKIMIWSSARQHNVERLCRAIFENVGITPPIHRWHRGNFNLIPEHFEMNIQLYKQLSWVWAVETVSKDLCSEGVFDQSNTILIDDSSEKAFSEPYNLVRVDEYNGTDQESDVLGKVVEYLERARRMEDVSAFVRDSPFVFRSTDAPYDWTSQTATSENVDITKPT